VKKCGKFQMSEDITEFSCIGFHVINVSRSSTWYISSGNKNWFFQFHHIFCFFFLSQTHLRSSCTVLRIYLIIFLFNFISLSLWSITFICAWKTRLISWAEKLKSIPSYLKPFKACSFKFCGKFESAMTKWKANNYQ
jgi:hypothetical protein